MKTCDLILRDILQKFQRMKTVHQDQGNAKNNAILDIDKPADMA